MVHIQQSALLPYSAERMFALVNDIDAYPAYMRGCQGAEILERSEHSVLARLELGKGGLRYALTTRNLLQPPERMTMTLVDGPFNDFAAEWRFMALSATACKTSLDLRFSFRAGLVDRALAALFEATGRDLVQAVCKRAETQYGNT